MNNEYTYYDKDGNEIVTLGEPIEDIIQRLDNTNRHIFELETGKAEADYMCKLKDDKIKELEKQVKKYQQYKGLFTVCSKELVRALDEIEKLKGE